MSKPISFAEANKDFVLKLKFVGNDGKDLITRLAVKKQRHKRDRILDLDRACFSLPKPEPVSWISCVSALFLSLFHAFSF